MRILIIKRVPKSTPIATTLHLNDTLDNRLLTVPQHRSSARPESRTTLTCVARAQPHASMKHVHTATAAGKAVATCNAAYDAALPVGAQVLGHAHASRQGTLVRTTPAAERAPNTRQLPSKSSSTPTHGPSFYTPRRSYATACAMLVASHVAQICSERQCTN